MYPPGRMHESWHSLRGLIHEEPLQTLKTNILPNISFNPKHEDIFRVLEMPVNKVKVVILGQDPYPNPNYATGYAFLSPSEFKIPSSMKIIMQEVLDSTGEPAHPWTWPEQGVLLLNTALTVERGKPGSHLDYWRPFMQRLISFLSITHPCIWMLWGNHAQSYRHYIKNRVSASQYNRTNISLIPIGTEDNLVLDASHPASEVYKSGNFLGCDHFYLANKILTKKRIQKVTW